MIIERSELLIRPLEEVFDPQSIENLRGHGVQGVIPIEISIEELWRIAEERGYKVDGVDPYPSDWSDKSRGMYWIHLKEEGETAVIFYTKNGPRGKGVYILDDELERFKELFLGEGSTT